jgi:hypothetical protein
LFLLDSFQYLLSSQDQFLFAFGGGVLVGRIGAVFVFAFANFDLFFTGLFHYVVEQQVLLGESQFFFLLFLELLCAHLGELLLELFSMLAEFR